MFACCLYLFSSNNKHKFWTTNTVGIFERTPATKKGKYGVNYMERLFTGDKFLCSYIVVYV